MVDDLMESVANAERFVDVRTNTPAQRRSADMALTMLRNAARVGTPTKVRKTLYTIVRLAPVTVLEAIRAPLETAQSFVFARTGEDIDITR